MKIPTSDKVFRLMGPENLDRAAEAVQCGVSEYFDLPALQRMHYTKRSRANIIHDLIRKASRRLFDEVRGVRQLDARGLYVLNFSDDLIVRFKKFDATLCSSGIPTQQSLLFLEQRELEGI